MEFTLQVEATIEASNKLDIAYRISAFLNNEILKKNYGSGVKKIIGVLNSYRPDFGLEIKHWATGTVIFKKYIKSQKYLEFDVKVNHVALMSLDDEDVPKIIKEAVLASYNEINELAIPDFHIREFYNDLEVLFDTLDWNAPIIRYQPPQSQKETDKPKAKYKPMKSSDFWAFIKDSIKFAAGDFEKQINYLTDLLAYRTPADIIGFELMVRSLMKKAAHVNVLVLSKIVDGIVTEDSFRDFRAQLILSGKTVYNQVISDPGGLAQMITKNYFSEQLLCIADFAYKKRKGENYHDELPSDIVADLDAEDLNDDEESVWDDNTFDKKYAEMLSLLINKKG